MNEMDYGYLLDKFLLIVNERNLVYVFVRFY